MSSAGFNPITSVVKTKIKRFLCGVKLYHLKKIKVGAVSYLNTKPLLYGIKRSTLMDKIELIEEYPAKIAQMLLDDEIDIGLVPVAIIPKLKEAHIITNFCIGSEGEVASVCLFSEVPMEKIERVLLDYQSRTSVNLVKILLREYWQKNVVFEEATTDFRSQIKGTTAGVVIGDRAFEQRLISPNIYDLAEAWKAFTGLPFVFAVWVANKPLNKDFIDAFSIANGYGITHIDEVIAENICDNYDLKTYYTENISYDLTDEKRKGLALFLSKLSIN